MCLNHNVSAELFLSELLSCHKYLNVSLYHLCAKSNFLFKPAASFGADEVIYKTFLNLCLQ